MKQKMMDFAREYELELGRFPRILATGTTGAKIMENASLRDRVVRYKSGPLGGDIQIATEILAHRCSHVVFFVDPFHSHPHIEDIRVVFGACMIENETRMLTNEYEASEWMNSEFRS